ncbi:hypothetical protein [Streptomyces sp. NPDC089795]|uniref:hypothetical protein n=1 Tax=Streptomyces sp. NPDC089795 TaxID=3155297 RepID=UPI00342AE7CA
MGAVTLPCTPYAGRLVDRVGPDRVNLGRLLGVLLSAAVLAAGGGGGAAGLAAPAACTLLLDLSMQSGMLADQARVYALRPDARSRLNTAYITCAYLGGSGGSWLGVRVHGSAGWSGVCVLVAVLAGIAPARHPAAPRRPGAVRTTGGGRRAGRPMRVGIGRPPAITPPVEAAGRTASVPTDQTAGTG